MNNWNATYKAKQSNIPNLDLVNFRVPPSPLLSSWMSTTLTAISYLYSFIVSVPVRGPKGSCRIYHSLATGCSNRLPISSSSLTVSSASVRQELNRVAEKKLKDVHVTAQLVNILRGTLGTRSFRVERPIYHNKKEAKRSYS